MSYSRDYDIGFVLKDGKKYFVRSNQFSVKQFNEIVDYISSKM